MKTDLDFTNPGGMPLDQSILSLMQEETQALCNALEAMFGTNNLIISGVSEHNGVLSNGIILINGKLRQFVGGTKLTHIMVTMTGTYRTYADGNSNVIAQTYVAIPSSTGVLFSSFVRVQDYKELVILANKAQKHRATYAGTISGAVGSTVISYNMEVTSVNKDLYHVDGWMYLNAQEITTTTEATVIVGGYTFAIEQYSLLATAKHITSGEEKSVIVIAESHQNTISYRLESALTNSSYYKLYIPIHHSILSV